MGVILPMEAPILEGPRGQNFISFTLISAGAEFGGDGDDAACRSDPTFTRASPGLAVAEQLPQIITVIIVIFNFLKNCRGISPWVGDSPPRHMGSPRHMKSIITSTTTGKSQTTPKRSSHG